MPISDRSRLCEGCRRRPATHLYARPGAGDPYRLCRACHPDR
jgi:hypothetical protein